MLKLHDCQFLLEPAPETRLEAGDVVVVRGEPDALEEAEIRLLQGTK